MHIRPSARVATRQKTNRKIMQALEKRSPKNVILTMGNEQAREKK